MLKLKVTIDQAIFAALRADTYGVRSADDAARAVTAIVRASPVFGERRRAMADEPGAWFPLARFADADFWAHQDMLLDHLLAGVLSSCELIEPVLPPAARPRVVPVTVHLVPGLTTCFGSGDGAQVFGLYDGATTDEALLFLAHTYYHELTSALATDATRTAEAEPITASRVRHLLGSLIQNEGIANYAVLPQVRGLRAQRTSFRYFTYAPMVDDLRATAAAMTACRTLMSRVTDGAVSHQLRRVSAAFKNPKLPVINLVGIHAAEAIARFHGEAVLLDVEDTEPQEFFRRYADTDDPLRAHLFGDRDDPGLLTRGGSWSPVGT